MMNLCWERLVATLSGELVAMLIIEVECEDFDFEGNLHDNA